MECSLCHKIFHGHESLKVHLVTDHVVQHDIELVVLLRLVTESEKEALIKQLKSRISETVSGGDLEHSQETISDEKFPEEKKKVLEVNERKSPNVANKIMFWRGIEKSPRHKVQELNGQKFFRKDETRDEKAVKEILKRTLTEHLKGEKSADDTIDIFDEIFATTCDLNESIDGNFRLLLEEDPCEMTVTEERSVSPNKSATEVNNDFDERPVVVPPRMKHQTRIESSKKLLNVTDGKYRCQDCGKSFKFLTYLKGHVNSKVGCKTRKQVPLYIR